MKQHDDFLLVLAGVGGGVDNHRGGEQVLFLQGMRHKG